MPNENASNPAEKRNNLSILMQMMGMQSINRNLKTEDCHHAETQAAGVEFMTGKESKCGQLPEDEMMVAGDYNVTNNQKAKGMPSWLAALLGAIAAIMGVIATMAILAALYLLLLNPPTEQPERSVRFVLPDAVTQES